MSNRQGVPGSTDLFIEEIPEGNYRIRIVGLVVNISAVAIEINDGTGQLTLSINNHSPDEFTVGSSGRFIAEITRAEDRTVGTLLAWNPITQELIPKYRKLVSIERRIPDKIE